MAFKFTGAGAVSTGDIKAPAMLAAAPQPNIMPAVPAIVLPHRVNVIDPPDTFIDGSLASPKLVKGRITNVRTRFFREFMFNMTEVDREDAWNWGHHGIPGASHPVLSGGHGGARIISFSVYLDGDRGRSNDRRQGSQASSLDITNDINFYRQFTYPVPIQQDQLRDRGPARVIFTFGPLYPSIECVVHDVRTKVLMWTPRLEPMRAMVSIKLEEFMRRTVAATDIFTEPTGSSTQGELLEPYGSSVTNQELLSGGSR